MTNKLITVASYSQVYEAHIARSFLENHGVDGFIADEHMVSTNWLYSNAIGGVRLQVRHRDVKMATDLLADHERALRHDGDSEIDWGQVDPDWSEETREESDSVYSCPECRCSDVYYEAFSRRLIFLSILLLGIPLPFLSRTWICDRCGNRWKNSLFYPFRRRPALPAGADDVADTREETS